MNLNAGIAELIIFKASIRKILTDVIDSDALNEFYTQDYFIVVLVAIAEIPPVLVSKIEKLKFLALGGVVCISVFMVMFVLLIIVATADSNPDNNPVGGMRIVPENWLLAAATVPNVLLAFSYQMNFFPIFKGMKNTSDKKMSRAVLLGLLFCLFCYLIVGILGYHYAGNDVKANFLESLYYSKVSHLFYYIINLSFIISLFLAFPIMFFGCRNNFIALIKLIFFKDGKGVGKGRGADQVEEMSSYMQGKTEKQRKRRAYALFIVYTMLIYLITIGVAVGVNDIEIVFNAVGALCSSSITIILPCIFYVKLTNINHHQHSVWYYASICLASFMAPYAFFSILALYLGAD